MGRIVQIYRCGAGTIKVVARASQESISASPNTPDEREMENKRTSLSRSRRIVSDIMHSNCFRFYLTVTLKNDENGCQPTRDDVVRVCKAGLRTIKRHSGKSVGYIIVPEQSDTDEFVPGRWHAHILLTDIPPDMLQPYNSSDKGLPAIIYRRMSAGIDCFATPVFSRHGYCLAEAVGGTKSDYDALAKYLTKTMYLDSCAPLPKGQKRIICSHGLARPVRIYSGAINDREYKAICDAAGDTLRNKDTLVHYILRSKFPLS